MPKIIPYDRTVGPYAYYLSREQWRHEALMLDMASRETSALAARAIDEMTRLSALPLAAFRIRQRNVLTRVLRTASKKN